jgi:hypothetical protein
LKATAKLLATVVGFFVFACVSIFAYFHYEAHVAGQMIAAVQNLELGQSTTTDVLPIVHQYAGVGVITGNDPCSTTENCSYFFRVAPLDGIGRGRIMQWVLERAFDLTNLEGARYLGIRPWFAKAFITLENGTVKDYSASVLVSGPCQKVLHASWEVADSFPQLGNPDEQWPNKVSDTLQIRWQGVTSYETGEGLAAYLRPEATPEERQAAFHLNLDCLTRMGNGCFLLSDILPDGVRWAHEHSQPLGFTTHTCRGLKDPIPN